MKNNLNIGSRFSSSFDIVKSVFLGNKIIKNYIDKFFKFFDNR